MCGLQLSSTENSVSISDLSRSGLRSSGGMAADPAVGKEQSCHENLRRFFPDNINSYISPTKKSSKIPRCNSGKESVTPLDDYYPHNFLIMGLNFTLYPNR